MKNAADKAQPIAAAEEAAGATPAGEAPVEAGTAIPATVPREEFDTLRAERDDLLKSLVRLQADFENYRKRIERDRGAEYHRAVGSAIEPILPALDDFERALEAHRDPAYEKYREGFEAIYRSLWSALAKMGVERIEVVGKPFDPHEEQAVDRVESAEHADGQVLAVLRPGYRFRDRVLRPAMVRVAVHPTPKTDA
jgi:molecular chaperone GrpE